jgi:hypothetical protein
MATQVQLGAVATGDVLAQQLSRRYGGAFASRAAIKALPAKNRVDGMLVMSADDGSMWRFSAARADATDVAEELLLIPGSGSGRWIRRCQCFNAKLACGFGTADAAPLLTLPENFVIRPAGFPYWENTVAWAGGSSSAIGISTTKASYNTKGDLLGGASGDVAAGLGAGIKVGTIGPKFDTLAEWQALLLVEGDSLRFDRITSVFTSGAGFAVFPLFVEYNGPATP